LVGTNQQAQILGVNTLRYLRDDVLQQCVDIDRRFFKNEFAGLDLG
jgi:hypothetical protein